MVEETIKTIKEKQMQRVPRSLKKLSERQKR